LYQRRWVPAFAGTTIFWAVSAMAHSVKSDPSRAPRRTAQRPREVSSALSLGKSRALLSLDRAAQCIDVTRPDVAGHWGFDPHWRGLGVDGCKLGGHGCSCFGLRIHRCSAKIEGARLPQCVSFRRWGARKCALVDTGGPQKKKKQTSCQCDVNRHSRERFYGRCQAVCMGGATNAWPFLCKAYATRSILRARMT
jgi:hypothetical protein